MKKRVIFVMCISLVLLLTNISGQTIIPGGFVNGTWTAANSPYWINGPIQIADGTTLVIEPGVTIEFQGYYKLLVMGQLLAIGNESDSITFTAIDTVSGWRGIRFDNTPSANDTSKLMYCTVKYGNTQGAPADIHGGGIFFNNFSKAVISHSLIANNNAESYCGGSGGGICCFDSSPIIIHNLIKGNKASTICYGSGGGIFNTGTGKPYIAFNIITENSAGYGGGIYCTHATILNNTVSNNISAYNGAGINCDGYGKATVRNNLIMENSGGNGAGIFVGTSIAILIEDNTIINNVSVGEGGGGIYSYGNTFIRRNIISNNLATNTLYGFGGGIYSDLNDDDISNNIIVNNYASEGGGVFSKSSTGEMNNNLIANNDAVNGGGIYFASESNPTLRNCIIWGNTAANGAGQVYLLDEPSDPTFIYCDIEGGSAAFNTAGNFYSGIYSNNLDTDPQFTVPSAGSGPTFNGYNADWKLLQNSVCFEAGDPMTICNGTDISGQKRISGCVIDLGPYEKQTSASLEITVATIPESSHYACDGSASVFASGGVSPYSILWNNGISSSMITGLCGGAYFVVVTDAAGCIRHAEVNIYNLLGVKPQAGEQISFLMYPIPATDFITIKTRPETQGILKIFNNMGAEMLSVRVLQEETVLNTTSLTNGMYIVVLRSGNQSFHQKLIISR